MGNGMLKKISLIILILSYFTTPFLGAEAQNQSTLAKIAENYVRLGLELGKFDKDYVDAYLGPKEWRDEANSSNRDSKALAKEIGTLFQSIKSYKPAKSEQVRYSALRKNIRAMDTRVRMVNGQEFSFREEAKLIYDAVIPDYDFTVFDQALAQINELMGNPDDLPTAVSEYRNSLAIANEKLDSVFMAALDECRKRSKEFISLPDNERFRIEYVTDKNWSGYNWYQGDNESLMQVNMDFPTHIDRPVDLGCHEGYPGHHVWNVLVENQLMNDNGWVEYTLFPLFSPFGLIAEGSANYGVNLSFPGEQKVAFEKSTLYPLAGLDPDEAGKLNQLNELTAKLAHAATAISVLYLDGEVSRDEAIAMRQKYSLVTRDRAEQGIRFTEQYRAYVINYTLGKDIVADYVERGTNTPKQRWDKFTRMLTELKTASDMIE